MIRKGKNRYKKKNRSFLLFKIAFIFYLLLFNLRYITSDTSAYLSDKSEENQLITAGIWVIPELELDKCGEGIKKDIEVDEGEIIDGNSRLLEKDSENETVANEVIEVDCEDKKNESTDEDAENTTSNETGCKSKEGKSALEKNLKSVSSAETKISCDDKDNDDKNENGSDSITKDEDVTDEVKKESDKSEDKSNEAVKENKTQTESDANKEKEEQKRVDDAQNQSDNEAESVDKSKEIITIIEQIEKVEGDSNEKEKEKATEKDDEVGK